MRPSAMALAISKAQAFITGRFWPRLGRVASWGCASRGERCELDWVLLEKGSLGRGAAGGAGGSGAATGGAATGGATGATADGTGAGAGTGTGTGTGAGAGAGAGGGVEPGRIVVGRRRKRSMRLAKPPNPNLFVLTGTGVKLGNVVFVMCVVVLRYSGARPGEIGE